MPLKRLGRGLLAVFFASGALLSVPLAMVMELLGSIWKVLSPGCNIFMQPGTFPMTPGCNAFAAVMWVVLIGGPEESFKAIWLFYRLRCAPQLTNFNVLSCWIARLEDRPIFVSVGEAFA